MKSAVKIFGIFTALFFAQGHNSIKNALLFINKVLTFRHIICCEQYVDLRFSLQD
ncbi:hypothetical protein SA3033_06425 [Aggregatibacter actinomycetemcomitans serotype d str. SA3033]|nr:hypothetical protein SA2149_05475 [Aggregatibacter actinomycetemcomitans serotype e str. SA2149]KYK79919.1 hypothetical protein SA2876_01460 [Aggregatibacter actinomycetemcomitans serotype e str. SA2876]KYK80707.1 hypothetical protein SC383S_03720 [Aggregatibacter actinomycetemcomitans SC383s]KYK83658.1 hypothetical protein SA3033_06425 [Aggregatibacter actinomycetemcomitans serotype d str. SA3033]KYK86367.1 hypothetical protein SA2200_07275 [Aggregatibacter actinomycetemcomitans serotype d 